MSIFLIASWLSPTSLFLFINIMVGTIFLISRLYPPKTEHPQHFDDGAYYSAPPLLQRAPSVLLDRVKSINFSSYKFTNQDNNIGDDDRHHQILERAPSILERVKSINFSLYKFSPQNLNTDYNIQPTSEKPLSRAPSLSLLERVKSFDFTSFYRSDSVNSNQHQHQQAELPPAEADSDTVHMSSPVHGEVKRSKSDHSNVIQRKLSDQKMNKSASENWRRKWEFVEEEEDEENDQVERRRPATTRLEKTESFGESAGDQGVDAKADDFINKFKQQLKLQRLNSLLRYRDMLKGE